MLDFLKKIFGSKEVPLTAKQKFERANGISFHIGFVCHNFLVREFDHHLDFYSNGLVTDFDQISRLMLHRDTVIRKAERAIANNELLELNCNDDDMAKTNAEIFLKILKTVIEYNDKFNPEYYYLKGG